MHHEGNDARAGGLRCLMARMPAWKRKSAEYLEWCSGRLLSIQTLKTYENVLRRAWASVQER